MNKYGSEQKQASDGTILDSKRECRRYEELLLLQRLGEISELKRQEKFVLIPAQPRFKERACTYTVDFVYRDKNGEKIFEDTKGMRTQQGIIRRKLMAYLHGIKVLES